MKDVCLVFEVVDYVCDVDVVVLCIVMMFGGMVGILEIMIVFVGDGD